jgi:PEP-CTERM motif
MKSPVKSLFAVIALALGATGASAATYSIDEGISGSWNFDSPDHYSYSYGSGTFLSGDSLLLNQSSTATAAFAPGTFNCISCSYTSTLAGGDTIFGNFTVDSFSFVANPVNPFQADLNFTDTFTVSGGTGAFTGASGGGTIFGTHFGALIDFIPQVSGASTERVIFSVTTAPVPEPETYAMLMAGLGVMGAVARRRKQQSA